MTQVSNRAEQSCEQVGPALLCEALSRWVVVYSFACSYQWEHTRPAQSTWLPSCTTSQSLSPSCNMLAWMSM